MKKTALIYLICSLLLAIIAMVAIMVPMALTGGSGNGNGEGEFDYGKLIIASSSAAGVYDGNTLTNVEWQLVEGTLQAGHTLSVNVSGAQTDAGISDNHINATVYDEQMRAVTSRYDIEYRVGTLEVKPRPICVTADSDMKLYDGNPLTAPGYSLSSDADLVNGHKIEVKITGKITDIGIKDNVVENVVIKNSKKENEDVSKNYDITTVNGKLVIYDEDTLVIESESDVKTFDGVPLTNSVWNIVSGKVSPEHTLEVKVTGIQKEIGQSDNAIAVNILNDVGEDVAATYDMICVPGILTVLRGKLEITSNNDEKAYDGTPLVNSGYVIEPINLQTSGLEFKVNVTGTQTEVGASDNTIEEVLIFDMEKNDVTNCFTIIKKTGKLIVKNSSANGGSGSGGAGLDLSGALGGGGQNDNTPIFKLRGDIYRSSNDKVYLKVKSFGDFNDQKNGWNDANKYYETVSGRSAYYLTSMAADNSLHNLYIVNITPLNDCFALPYYSHQGTYSMQNDDVEILGDSTTGYTVEYYNWDNYSGISLPSGCKEYEEKYYQYVKENYLNVDYETRSYMEELIEEQSFNPDNTQIIRQVATYIQNAARYNLQYDQAMDTESNVVIAFLDKYQEGVCRHYASAATLLYRTLGIPARYTIGYTGDVVRGGETIVTAQKAHAWVEVYVKGIGWVNVEVTGGGAGSGSGSGSGSQNPIKLDVTPTYTGREYSGTNNVLYADNSVTGLESLDKMGYNWSVEVSGLQRGLGKSESTITQLIIYDGSTVIYDYRKNIGTDRFDIRFHSGEVQIYISELVFESVDREATYDGTPLNGQVNDCSFTSGYIDTREYSISIVPGASLTNVGKISNSFSVQIKKDGVNVTDHFKIVKNYGYLTLKARSIEITAASDEKKYDGRPLKKNAIDYDALDLAEGDRIRSYEVEGTITNPGEVANIIKSVLIVNQNGEDVTKNYSIKLIEGILKVNPV